jgi:hypothetical protein
LSRTIIAVSSVDGDSAFGANAFDQIEPAFHVLPDGIDELHSCVKPEAKCLVWGQFSFRFFFLAILIDPLTELHPIDPDVITPVPLVRGTCVKPIVESARWNSQVARNLAGLI